MWTPFIFFHFFLPEGCPPGYVQFEKQCFYANYLRTANWTSAHAHCDQYWWNQTGVLAEPDDVLNVYFVSNLAAAKT